MQLSTSIAYSEGVHMFPAFNVPEEAKRLRVSMTRENWPEGGGGHAFLTYPGGLRSHFFSFAGGVHIDRLGTRVDVVSAEFTIEQDGLPADVPAGEYILELELLQPLTSSIWVEWL